MPRKIAFFTGQWADVPLERLAKVAASWGYDGLELATWGGHFDAARAVNEDMYAENLRSMLADYGLTPVAISAHLIGQAVSDGLIDDGTEGCCPPTFGATANRKGFAPARGRR